MDRFIEAPSWFQLYLGVNGALIPEGLNVHHVLVDDWSRYTDSGGTLYCSIPSLLDSSLAPPGRHTVHAFVTDRADDWTLLSVPVFPRVVITDWLDKTRPELVLVVETPYTPYLGEECKKRGIKDGKCSYVGRRRQ